MQFHPRSVWFLASFMLSQIAAAKTGLAVDAYVTAVSGQPYSVATIEIPIETPVTGREFSPLRVTDADRRILFPISDDLRIKVNPPVNVDLGRPGGRLLNRVGGLIRELTNREDDLEQTVARRVSFLIDGGDPIRVQLSDATGPIGLYDVVPQQDNVVHAEILGSWWNSFTEAARRQIDSADYPAWVENYLVAMLSARVGLPLPAWYSDTEVEEDELLSTLKLIAGTEASSEAAFRRAAAGGQVSAAVASMPLPDPPAWAPSFSQDNLANVPVEPIATRVPAECFMIRYGSFENYLWFRDLSDEYGGDLSRMVTLRGFENDGALRVEKQLSMKMTELSRMLGPSVIEDQAIIGRDLFMVDGASMGVLIKAKNAFLLRTSLSTDRSNVAASDDAITLKDVKIAGRPVTFLNSSDNRVRSFMAVDGEYIFVSNSRSLVQRFFEVGKSGESLATTSSFRLARQLMPLEREDVIFAYFSPDMLRGLVSPQYMIELRRRLDAKADVALVHLARIATAQDRKIATSIEGIDELTAAGYLPQGFGTRPDGSGVITVGDQVVDTLRGARGNFLPIADVAIDAVTAEESNWYGRIADEYSRRFPTIDPIMIGVQRQPVEGDDSIERITVHAEIAPWDPGKYGKIAKQLGPPTNVAMRFAPDDIIALQAHVASPQLGPPTHLFVGIKDTVPPEPEEFEGLLNIYRSLRQLPGYLGAWPLPGTLDRLPLGLGRGTPIGGGMSRLIGGLYRYTDDQFSILSFQPEVIQSSLPFLAAVDAEDQAQIRARVGNLNGSRISGWVNGQLYDRARESSVAGANFLSMLSRQLNVEPALALPAAERILGSKLQCALGGQYEFSTASQRWVSTAWGAEMAPLDAPANYVAPAMEWFRGLDATVTQYDDRLVADAVIDVARH